MSFDKDFKWGAATAAYQIEGAFDKDGKGLSIWDTFCQKKDKIKNGDTGKVACDHYHLFKEDIKLMKKIGLESYRFSIAWTRIFPKGLGEINQKGLYFYIKLVDELIKAGIEPVITLYHWDLPQSLQDIGGWESNKTIEAFVNYAEVIFKTFNGKVKKFITHNEPFVVSMLGNFKGIHAPGIKDKRVALKVAHNLMRSHGLAVKKFSNLKIDGEIGITLNLTKAYSYSKDSKDIKAAKLFEDYLNNWFLGPILKGKYPEKLLKIYQDEFENIDFLQKDLDIISEPIDFLGINYYSRALVKYNKDSKLYGIETIKKQSSEYTAMNWEIYPKGLYDLLINIKENHADIPLYITENGAAFEDKVENGRVNDKRRIDYLKKHFKSAKKAIEDGVDLKGYFVWSLMDNFEWAFGYSKRFGIIHIDYETKKRTLKDSAYYYKKVIKENSII